VPYVDLNSLHSPTPGESPPAEWGATIRENFEWFQGNRRQICTSSTRPTGFEGLEIYETDTNKARIHDGSGWVTTAYLGALDTYTPTFTQSATITKTVLRSEYSQIGRHVCGDVSLAATSSGTSSNAIVVSAPVTSASAIGQPVGSGYLVDSSAANQRFPFIAILATTTTFQFVPAANDVTGLLGAASSTFTLAVASGDTISFEYRYAAAASA
jgi:hypothetical protein